MRDISINVDNISKHYGTVTALDSISLSVNKGELFGFIGPDGAGKTTLFRILTTLILPDSGKASVEDLDVVKNYKEIRRSVGYMPGKFSLYMDLSVEENLKFYATIFGTTVEENYDLIKDIYSQIEPFRNRKAGKLSGGMKQKLALSCALIHKPSVLFLDEPTTGVDAVSRREFWEMLKRLKEGGITILVSTPYMDEASLCDRVTLIQNGKILKISTPGQIISEYPRPLLNISSDDIYRLIQDMPEYQGVISSHAFGHSIHVSLEKDIPDFKEIETFLNQKGHSSVEINRITASVEDCFMELMEKK
ncbi:MAG: ABC transporter ATP-binding protein [Bacteroidota bacterium]|nr:ABC transporter ATP-binding protein [Bacteroidota bacterium]